ncbi:hypothetical protein JMK10_10825 [Rhodovulum sulfidophilum]|nr:hypothetical protein [Rhodovulum sulfidophilum]MBL3574619.1 hypothetical protein [Rhodovulum sulfidophilum]MCE8431160.1 hypothetical protein [Rhodovulum sulfidophilum]MCF4117295.1 hypothetical protein [Rhodovulum sulfidophilum]
MLPSWIRGAVTLVPAATGTAELAEHPAVEPIILPEIAYRIWAPNRPPT